MSRRFVPFDDTYRVPARINVSRGVRQGERLFLCGQMALDKDGQPVHANDLIAQSELSMKLVYDVIRHAGMEPDDMAQLHVFYRNTGGVDERAYRERLAGMLRGTRRPVPVFTPNASFPDPASEVEIDAVCVRDPHGRATEGPGGWPEAVRRADMIFARGEPPAGQHGGIDHRDDPVRQTGAALESLRSALAGVGCSLPDLCRLAVYVREDQTAEARRRMRQRLAEAFAGHDAPVLTVAAFPWVGRDGEVVRLEGVAMRRPDGGQLPRRAMAPGEPWRQEGPWPHAMRCGDVVFVGCQAPVDREGHLVHPGDIAGQTHAVMRHMEAALSAMGTRFSEVAKVNSYFAQESDVETWKVNVGIRSDYYGPPGPASTGIEVPALEPEGALIVADCIALVG